MDHEILSLNQQFECMSGTSEKWNQAKQSFSKAKKSPNLPKIDPDVEKFVRITPETRVRVGARKIPNEKQRFLSRYSPTVLFKLNAAVQIVGCVFMARENPYC